MGPRPSGQRLGSRHSCIAQHDGTIWELMKLVLAHCPTLKGPSFQADYISPLGFCYSEKVLKYLLSECSGFGDDKRGICLYSLLGRPGTQHFLLETDTVKDHKLGTERIRFELLQREDQHGIVAFIPHLLQALGPARLLAMFPSRLPTGDSALCLAPSWGDLNFCRALLSAGADIEFDGHGIGSPLAVAIAYGHLEVVKYLIRAGAKMVYLHQQSSSWKSAFRFA
ncbi:hypothetical protein BDV19DRAFT_387163 [Aspergillus venezuelensis]